jgi:hypothetical protein
MKRLGLFLLPGLLIAAGLQLHQQHATGLGWLPQQQAVTTAAAEVHRIVCGRATGEFQRRVC